MLRSPLFRRLFLPYLLLVCGAVALVGVFAATRLRATYLERTRTAVSDESRLVGLLMTDDLRHGRADAINIRARILRNDSESRITIVDSNGVVIADSDAQAPRMDNHARRPEILAAAGGGEGFSIRYSDTLHEDLFYFARRIQLPVLAASPLSSPAQLSSSTPSASTSDFTGSGSGVFYIRLARRLSDLDASLRQLYEAIFFAALLTVALAGGLCYFVARRHATPLVELIGFANTLARGDLNRRLLSPGEGEIATLGQSLNMMADALSRLLTQTRQDKAELLTILASMNEGVIATDLEQRILLVNDAAATLLGFDAHDAAGKRLWGVVRHAPILQFAAQVLETHRARTFPLGPISGRHLEITLCAFPSPTAAFSPAPAPLSSLDAPDGNVTIRGGLALAPGAPTESDAGGTKGEAPEQTDGPGKAGAALRNPRPAAENSAGFASPFRPPVEEDPRLAPGAFPQGLILVAHDTTQSVQYQELRKEFVANVSHELRTPLSIIKGFSETLRDGALGDLEKGPQYLRIIENHADQLTNLVNDLLELSKLESPGGHGRSAPVDIAAVVRRVRDLLLPAAQRKQQVLTVRVDADLPVVVGDADYIQRAVANLVDNAVKYTPEAGRIAIDVRVQSASTSADRTQSQPASSAIESVASVIVEVSDNGIGIPQEDLPRIFERFYRVDRSRSREMGGTGLGLSIVKHVVQAHGGRIEVTSVPAQGSRFRLYFPARVNAGRS